MNSENDNNSSYDLCIIGGGVNGAGIARDAAGRGLKVLLVEQDDLGQGTSSRSGKLVHGGLRYLEYYEFRLVREALIEREVLMASAPHIIWPMRFVLPHNPAYRQAWLVRAGLFLYDHLGGRKRLPGTRVLNLHKCDEGKAIKKEFKKAFEYSDCWVDDSRLVLLNALDASNRGADIRSRTVFKQAKRGTDEWTIDIQSTSLGKSETVKARCLVNAAGPWVNDAIDKVADVESRRRVRLVKGSHLVTRKFWMGENAYLVQNHDKRVIFINPYESDKALIGTTDIPYEGDPGKCKIDEAEIDYLLDVVNQYFNETITRDDIQDSFSGVRPLYDDNSDNPSSVTRDYLFDVDSPGNAAPIISIFGGKITTYRKLAEHALGKLDGIFPEMNAPWTSSQPLPGGDIKDQDFDCFCRQLYEQYSKLPAKLLNHYARLYGTRVFELLDGVQEMSDLGQQFSNKLYEREALFLVDREWAKSAEDILKRRTKHGLHMSKVEISRFSEWFDIRFNIDSKLQSNAS